MTFVFEYFKESGWFIQMLLTRHFPLMPADSIEEKILQLYQLEASEMADYVLKDTSILSKEVCKYLVENPEFFDLDVFDFPHYSDVVLGMIDGSFVKSDLDESIIKHKIKLLQLTFEFNGKMLKNEKIPVDQIDEDLVLEAMQVGLIQGKIGSHLVLQYCRPKERQEWLLTEIGELKKRLISVLQQ